MVKLRYVKVLYCEKFMSNKVIGVLGVQGGFSRHADSVNRLGFKSIIVKTAVDLAKIDKLIMPGGESTAMRLMLQKHGLWNDLKDFAKSKPVFGTCAGAILLADTINTGEESLGAIKIDIKRNSYGRQIDSFEANLELDLQNKKVIVPSMFIRAPEITRIGTQVKVLAHHNDLPVLVQDKHVLVATFHPELTHDDTICEYFINEV